MVFEYIVCDNKLRKTQLNANELAIKSKEHTNGSASITLMDPDANQILIDQHR